MPIYIPPLRLRNNDILLLANHLLQKLNQDYGRNIEVISKDAEKFLLDYHWPGNVRELENILGRAIIHMSLTDTQINRSHISLLSNNHNKMNTASKNIAEAPLPEKSLTDRLDEFEKELLIEALKTFDGNKTRAAKSLGISLRNFYYKLEKYGIDEKVRK
jgi:transcriptional regulator with PAS, ATPase and Fis domain